MVAYLHHLFIVRNCNAANATELLAGNSKVKKTGGSDGVRLSVLQTVRRKINTTHRLAEAI